MTDGIRTDQRHFADLLLRGGPVYTVDSGDSVVGACAVRDGRIIGTGGVPDLLHLVGPGTKVIDLQGKCLLPGLIDAHSHITGHGQDMAALDCKHGVASVADIVAKVRAAAAAAPKDTWIVGRGYDQKKLAEGRHPLRADLDQAAPDHPVALTRTCGHILACNSAALHLAGIDAGTPDPVGGEIDRDAAGVPTGVLRESACRPVHLLLAPALDALREAYIEACRDYNRHGITSSHDASGMSPLQIRTMIEAHNAGAAHLRTYMMMRFGAEGSAGDAAVQAGAVTGLGGAVIRMGPLKAMVDGSSSGPTAATRSPNASEPDRSGILYFSAEQLDALVAYGAAAGFQVTAHCVGDRAVGMMLDAIRRSGADAPARRHRIEHCAMLNPDYVRQIRQLGIVPVANPCFPGNSATGMCGTTGRSGEAGCFQCAP